MTRKTAVTATGMLILSLMESVVQRGRQIKQAKRQINTISVKFKCLRENKQGV